MMRDIKINGRSFPLPKDFEMNTAPNIVSEITTMSGNLIADVNGWVYQDTTLAWDWLDADVLTSLMEETQDVFDFTFDDMNSGVQKTIKAYRKGTGGKKIATITPDNKVQWTGIQISVGFPDCYR